jgi:heme exporter protein B
MKQTAFFQVALAILRKDLVAELRSRELLSSMALFALLSILIFSFALELTGPLLAVNRELAQINNLLQELGQEQLNPVDPLSLSNIISGVLWVTLVFAVILGLNRSLAAEREQGNMDAMLVAPIDRSAVFVGKMIANYLFALVVGLILLPLITILFNINLLDLRLLATLLLGVLGFSSVGTLLAAMATQTRSRETLLPIIMLPAVLPVLLAVVRASNGIITGAPTDLWGGWLGMLAIIDLIYLIMCFVLFPFVIED